MRRALRCSQAAIRIGLLLLSVLISGRAWASEQAFAFALLADPRGQGESWKNALSEIRDMKTNPAFGPAELVVAAGDLDPLAARYSDFRKVFASADTRPLFLPVVGNHEFEDGGEHFRYARDTLIPSIPNAVRRHASSCDYYLDHRNMRIIVVDGYTDLGKSGVINDEGRRWVEQAIKAAPSNIDHIFIAFHEPAFPRVRHIAHSFDRDPELRNAFWRMLLKYRDRVRAVLVGHTHAYSRMRVLDPAGTAAGDTKAFPDEEGGIYQIDAGAAGNGDRNTVVLLRVEGRKLLFRALQAKNGPNSPFVEIDGWKTVYDPRTGQVEAGGKAQ